MISRLALMLLPLTACSSSEALRVDVNPVVELRSRLAVPPAELRRPCEPPQTLPAGRMSAGTVTRLWGADRAALVECESRHGRLDKFVADRDARLSAAKP